MEFGCEAVAWESLYEYNRTVFEYLDKKYGKKWRKKIRQDIVGLKEEWKYSVQQRVSFIPAFLLYLKNMYISYLFWLAENI